MFDIRTNENTIQCAECLRLTEELEKLRKELDRFKNYNYSDKDYYGWPG